jgi:hypothetical protein
MQRTLGAASGAGTLLKALLAAVNVLRASRELSVSCLPGCVRTLARDAWGSRPRTVCTAGSMGTGRMARVSAILTGKVLTVLHIKGFAQVSVQEGARAPWLLTATSAWQTPIGTRSPEPASVMRTGLVRTATCMWESAIVAARPARARRARIV